MGFKLIQHVEAVGLTDIVKTVQVYNAEDDLQFLQNERRLIMISDSWMYEHLPNQVAVVPAKLVAK